MVALAEKISKASVTIRQAKAEEIKKFGFSANELKSRKIFVAVHEGKVVGSCLVEIITGRKEGMVNVEIYEKEFIGMGIGHRLLGKAHAFLHSKGIRASRAESPRCRLGFYKKAGYRKIGAIEAGPIVLAHKMVRVPERKQRRIR